MKTYKITFEGREKGAIGKFYKFTKTVKASDFKKALLSLYDNYDHIHPKTVNGVRYDPFNEPE